MYIEINEILKNNVSPSTIIKRKSTATTHIAQNIAETMKYFQSFIAIGILPQHTERILWQFLPHLVW